MSSGNVELDDHVVSEIASVLQGMHKAFVGGLNWQTTEDGLIMYFEQFGPVLGATIMRDRFTGQPRGFGFVSFEKEETVEKVCATTKHNIDGKEVEVKPATRKSGGGVGDDGSGEGKSEITKSLTDPALNYQDVDKKIFVGGLWTETNEEQIAKYFNKFGKVKGVIIKYDPATNRSRGFGFVTFETAEGFQKAFEYPDAHIIMGKRVETKKYNTTGGGGNTSASNQTSSNVPAPEKPVPYSKRTFADVYRRFFEAKEREEAQRHRRRDDRDFGRRDDRRGGGDRRRDDRRRDDRRDDRRDGRRDDRRDRGGPPRRNADRRPPPRRGR